MIFGDIIKCPFCNESLPENQITIKRTNLRNRADTVDDYFAGDNEKLCRKQDNIFVKGYCPTCDKKVEVMVLVDVKPIKCYSAGSVSDLVMID